jgi:Uma2 family endonuclease
MAAPSLYPSFPPPPVLPTTRAPAEECRVLMSGVPWSTYVMLRDSVATPGIRMTYLDGQLEVMNSSREHEVGKANLARFLELFCAERGISLYACGTKAFRNEAKKCGLEPDGAYCRGMPCELPEVALEVVLSHSC